MSGRRDSDRGMYTTARVACDVAIAAERDRTARGKIELWHGCRCKVYNDAGEPVAWADHPTAADCPADPALDEVLQMLGFTETRRLPQTTLTRTRVRNATGTGRWPAAQGA